ncbi:MAG: hypothetical protein NC926_10085 [Candidatus Omnitrophica bacterium]|nr:hypothetical protein [Candidatus Omnitrophota bacterium]
MKLIIIFYGLIQFLLLISWKCFSNDTFPLKSVNKFDQSKNISETTKKETDVAENKEKVVIKYYKTGEKKAYGPMKNGKMVGHWIVFWPDGTKSHEEDYDEEGRRHGKQVFFNRVGEPVKEIYWNHGKMIKSKDLISGAEKNYQ